MKENLLEMDWTGLSPDSKFYLFISQDSALLSEYEQGMKLPDAFTIYSVGIATARDSLTIHESPEEVHQGIWDFAELTTEKARKKYELGPDTRDWKVTLAQEDVSRSGPSKRYIAPILYRPFDRRWTYYTGYSRGIICMPRPEVMRHMLSGTNVALCVGRAGQVIGQGEWNIVACSRHMTDLNLFRRGGNVLFPLYLLEDESSKQGALTPDLALRPNLGPRFIGSLCERLGLKTDGAGRLPHTLSAEDIFHYAYAVFHSPGYRSRYAEFLKIDFPRLPLTSSLELFHALAKLGSELVALHLMESPELNNHITTAAGSGEFQVEKVSYSDETVWLDKAKTRGFRGVPEAVWNFHIGGYQVCEKWLKDRGPKRGKLGRVLTQDDITHYNRIVVALNETIRLMKEIDRVIEEHGGWPDAFVTDKSDLASREPSSQA